MSSRMRVWMPNTGHPSPAEVKSWVWYHAFIIPGLGEAEASRSQGSLANQLSLSTDRETPSQNNKVDIP